MVKTTRQMWTDKGNLPPKTINAAVKFRVVDSAGEDYVACVVAKQMNAANSSEPCDMSDIGGINGTTSGIPYPWYNFMYDMMVQDYLVPSELLPQQIYWEVVNLAMARRFMAEFDGKNPDRPKIIGVSTIMQVDGTAQTTKKATIPGLQPGNHGTLVTIGDIEPLDYNVLTFSNIFRGTYPSDGTVAPDGDGWFAYASPIKTPEWTEESP